MTDTADTAEPTDANTSEVTPESTWRQRARLRRAHRRQVRQDARAAWKTSGVGWRVFPRTLLGICLTLTAVGVGAGAAGAVLFVYYDGRLEDNEVTLSNTAIEVEQRVVEGVATIEDISALGAERVTSALGPYADYALGDNGLPVPAAAVADAIFVLSSRDTEGRSVVATATAVSVVSGRTLLVTAYSSVAAATADPGPPVTVNVAGRPTEAEVVRWDEELDLAVVSVGGVLPVVRFAPVAELGVSAGAPVFAVSASALTATPGVVAVVDTAGLRHTAAVDADFAGGPVVDTSGQVLGFTAPGYRPGGAGGFSVPWAPTVIQACGELLNCDRT